MSSWPKSSVGAAAAARLRLACDCKRRRRRVAPRPGCDRGDIGDTRRLLPPGCSCCLSSLWHGSSTAGGHGALRRKRSSAARRPLQVYYLRRLAHTLRLAPSPAALAHPSSLAPQHGRFFPVPDARLLAQRRLFCSPEVKEKNCWRRRRERGYFGQLKWEKW
ncbi:hypothetical protein OsI_36467 [Oryza sativa Indica Group]|jgi:hypothetical protein|uniref:Uncharacterized protein n=1 Tax=Oryza sativa subsp. indica TaxID=39946 RepID=A2ZFA5_ORYSI|nr:hypothetical protein OsI_36467 [Oryza sativa Indica Group]